MQVNKGGSSSSMSFSSGQFSSSGVSVPVEIVEAGQDADESGGLSQSEMEIEIEELSSTRLASNNDKTLTASGSATSQDNAAAAATKNLLAEGLANKEGSVLDSNDSVNTSLLAESLGVPQERNVLASANTSSLLEGLTGPQEGKVLASSADNPSGLTTMGMDSAHPIDQALGMQQVSQAAMQQFQEVSRSLRHEGIEMLSEAIANHFPHSFAETLVASMTSSSQASLLESAISQSAQSLLSYNELNDVSRVINSGMDPSLTSASPTRAIAGGSIDSLLEHDVASSPESQFDTNDLLNPSVPQDDEITSKLASAGPVGVAAAAAIMSTRKRKKHLSFESNPALRKRYCSKLMRRLKENLDELSTRVGLQACVVTYRPSSKQDKPEAIYKVFGTSPLTMALDEQKDKVIKIMDQQLTKQTPSVITNFPKEGLFDLPPLVFDGIPTSVNEMTQAQLRAFIPTILKFSTGRGKPGWGKDELRPEWWPVDLPWKNVRSDCRTDEAKKAMAWSECLRKIVISCYLHHNRGDLLNMSSSNKAPANQQQQQEMMLSNMMPNSNVPTLTDVSSTQEDSQQVFTIDTGVGNCDASGMPTLADASLAETAARLQQVADETGQVQYATQTVTVTENDAKALGQPPGSTTTVLLTAYPSGQGTTESEDYYQPTASSSASAPSVQVVYSASHVSELPDSIVSTISATTPEELYTTPSTVSQYPSEHGTTGDHTLKDVPTTTDSTQYLTTPTSVSAKTKETMPTEDLASQYINFSKGVDSSNILATTASDFVASLTGENPQSKEEESETNMETEAA